MVHNNFVSSVCALQLLPFIQSFQTYFMEEKRAEMQYRVKKLMCQL